MSEGACTVGFYHRDSHLWTPEISESPDFEPRKLGGVAYDRFGIPPTLSLPGGLNPAGKAGRIDHSVISKGTGKTLTVALHP